MNTTCRSLTRTKCIPLHLTWTGLSDADLRTWYILGEYFGVVWVKWIMCGPDFAEILVPKTCTGGPKFFDCTPTHMWAFYLFFNRVTTLVGSKSNSSVPKHKIAKKLWNKIWVRPGSHPNLNCLWCDCCLLVRTPSQGPRLFVFCTSPAGPSWSSAGRLCWVTSARCVPLC